MDITKENEMFGMTVEEIKRQYMDSITAKFSGLEMVVAGILSDCQELNEMNDGSQRIRKQLNVAKYILFEILNGKEKSS